MNSDCCSFLVAAVSLIAGCSPDVDPATETESATLVPFSVSSIDGLDHRWGFRESGGKVVLPAQYLDVDSFFCEGFAWVNTDYCEHPIPGPEEKRWAEMPQRGTFIDSSGRPLALPHAHSVHEPWDCDFVWKPPRFDHGLAFVRLSDGLICGMTTNGVPLDVHAEFGMFADSSTNPQMKDKWYWHYRGDWALVGLVDGRLGVLDGTRHFAVGPTNDAAFVRQRWRNGLSFRDPFDFPDAAACGWMDSPIDLEGPMLLPLWKLCLYLKTLLNKNVEPEGRLLIDCDYDASRSGILIKESPKTIRSLLDQVRRDNDVFPLISRAGIYFVGAQ